MQAYIITLEILNTNIGYSQDENEGYYKSIKNGSITFAEGTNATGEQLFKVDDVASNVRTLTLPELNKSLGRMDIDSITTISAEEDTKGIYRLDQLTRVPRISNFVGYPMVSYADVFWIASPYPQSNSKFNLFSACKCRLDGSITGEFNSSPGVRPVVSLQGSKFQLKAVGNEGTYKMDY